MSAVSVWTVFVAALVTALATGLGAVPLLLFRSSTERALGIANAVAAGVMLGASLSLVLGGFDRSVPRTLVGALIGLAFILVAARLVQHDDHAHIGSLHGDDARKGLLIVAVMTVHSFAEGVGVGAAFGGGAALGILITVAIAVHNIPEGLAISLVLVPRGVSVPRAAGWSIFSSLPQPLIAVPAFLFVEAAQEILPVGLGFAAGAMTWMVASELIPEALKQAPRAAVALTTALSFGAMVAFQLILL